MANVVETKRSSERGNIYMGDDHQDKLPELANLLSNLSEEMGKACSTNGVKDMHC